MSCISCVRVIGVSNARFTLKLEYERKGERKMESRPVVESRPAAEGGTKSGKMWIAIMAIIVLGGVNAAFFMFPSLRAGISDDEERVERVRATVPLESFLVNLADKEEIRFVKTTFHLGCAEQPKEKLLGVAIAPIRDSIISLLSSKNAAEILTPEGKAALRQEIRSRVNELFPQMKVLEVYIVEFVVQL